MRACPRLRDILQNNWPGFFKKKKRQGYEKQRKVKELFQIKEA